MAYADYTFYTETYKGKSIPEADFGRLVTRASSYLDRMGVDLDPDSASVQMAACAVAEAWQTNEQGGDVVSQSVAPGLSLTRRKPSLMMTGSMMPLSFICRMSEGSGGADVSAYRDDLQQIHGQRR